jgi:RimJ/RimL family protein N-acetyltransferase
MPPHSLKTPRLILRQWRDADLAPFAALNASPAVMRFMSRALDREASDALARRIHAQIDETGYGLFAVEAPGVAPFIGFTGLSVPPFEAHFTPCIEIGWRLARAFWGFGYATEAATAVLAFAFDTLRLPEIVSFTTAGNQRSRAVMERLGMTRDPADDFDHPALPEDHPLRPHVLYRSKQAALF